MIVKNEDAKDKWCPHSRVVFTFAKGNILNPVGNRHHRMERKDDDGKVTVTEYSGVLHGSHCLGVECMLWLPLSPLVGRCGFLNASRGDWDGMTND